ncbi:NAD(P)/FAD-dependent oxidoreductase [Salarchaeum japonicum]|uniref:FAD/NAD(P)-binding domain-containing protein n=1 Tax=Salarchaeum japonicum TaxID=555573 RepID=A0AAV3T222_9EURY|nr:FAD-dependent oxidoreductase [Salarchaeum japonicum]
MSDVLVVGGGAAGLSAGLFTAKNGLDTKVFDTDGTWLHKAHLFNYLGIRSIDGSVFHERARKHASDDHGAELHDDEEVESVTKTEDGRFHVVTGEDEYESDYLVLATGANRDLAEELGADFDGDVVDVGVDMETSVENAYATGAMVRDQEWQAVISAGDGAAAALDILSKEEGEHYHDFDVPDDV